MAITKASIPPTIERAKDIPYLVDCPWPLSDIMSRIRTDVLLIFETEFNTIGFATSLSMSGDGGRLNEGLGILDGALTTNELEDCSDESELIAGDINVFVTEIEVPISVELLAAQGGGVYAIGGQL